jgi:choice-of-anchor C domain-containing protein
MNSKARLMGAGAAVALAATALAGTVQAANLLTNGSFDSTPCGAGYCNYAAGGEPAGFGWSVTTNNVDIVPGPGAWGTPEDGPQMLDLVGYGSTGGIAQSFATTSGATYNLSFYYANNPYPSGPDSADVTVTGAGSLLSSSVTHTTSTPSDLDWIHFTGSFTADSSLTTLAFNETAGGGNAGVFLDNVSVTGGSITRGVPEPATWAMMLIGFGGLGALMRRRRDRAAFAA